MQNTSNLYQELLASNHWVETSLVIGEEGRLINEDNYVLTFGGSPISLSRGGGDSGYREDMIISIETTRSLFSGNTPEVGACVSCEIDVKLRNPTGDIPRMAQIVPYIRLTDGYYYSEWIQKGLFYIDTRSIEDDNTDEKILTLHGYDAMLKAEQIYPEGTINYPATDTAVVQEIADAMGVQVDDRTWEIMTNGYSIPYPATYTCREVLGYIAAMYAGCWTITDQGNLYLVQISGIPEDDRYLVDSVGDAIVFGSDRILV